MPWLYSQGALETGVFLGSITEHDIDALEDMFAYFTGSGWQLPAWLVYLRQARGFADA